MIKLKYSEKVKYSESAENNRHLLFAASVGAKEPVQGDVHGSVVAIKVLRQNKCERMLSDTGSDQKDNFKKGIQTANVMRH